MKQTTIISVILGVLVVISAVQAFQLNNLKADLAEGQMTVSTVTTQSTPLATQSDTPKKTAALPSSIKDLPQMVGGC